MCRLKIKVRIIGKKNQEFVRFILTPKNIKQKGKYHTNLGFWDIRQNRQMRFIVLNIYKIMYFYSYGATPNKTTLRHIYAYFIDLKHLNSWFYFKEHKLILLIENEIKKKYFQHPSHF